MQCLCRVHVSLSGALESAAWSLGPIDMGQLVRISDDVDPRLFGRCNAGLSTTATRYDELPAFTP